MTKEFLNEQKLPFKDCTREQQHILMDSWLDGNLEAFNLHHTMQGWSSEYNEQVLKANWILRTKPIKRLAIPWEYIKEGFNYAVIARDGRVNLHSEKPYVCEIMNCWAYSGAYVSINMLDIDTSGINWEDSLVERPATEVKS